MHATGVKFDRAFFVGQSAQSDGIVVRIIFRALDHAESSVQCIAAVLQKNESVVKVIHAIVGTDDDWPLARAKRPSAAGGVSFGVILCA